MLRRRERENFAGQADVDRELGCRAAGVARAASTGGGATIGRPASPRGDGPKSPVNIASVGRGPGGAPIPSASPGRCAPGCQRLSGLHRAHRSAETLGRGHGVEVYKPNAQPSRAAASAALAKIKGPRRQRCSWSRSAPARRAGVRAPADEEIETLPWRWPSSSSSSPGVPTGLSADGRHRRAYDSLNPEGLSTRARSERALGPERAMEIIAPVERHRESARSSSCAALRPSRWSRSCATSRRKTIAL